jgi:hypothetical protein
MIDSGAAFLKHYLPAPDEVGLASRRHQISSPIKVGIFTKVTIIFHASAQYLRVIRRFVVETSAEKNDV